MGSVILDGAEIGEGAFIGAGSLVPPGKTIPPGCLAFYTKVIRRLTEEDIQDMERIRTEYVEKDIIKHCKRNKNRSALFYYCTIFQNII